LQPLSRRQEKAGFGPLFCGAGDAATNTFMIRSVNKSGPQRTQKTQNNS
jgi:hypothetical protein